MNLILCGPPACGKSYLGRLVAKQLQWPFIDTDCEIERIYFDQVGVFRKCREIDIHEGDNHFRQLEKGVVSSLSHLQRTVIALGGGTLDLKESRETLKKMGRLIFLKTDFKVIWERISRKPALPSMLDPKRPQASLEELIQRRSRFYEECSDTIIATDQLDESALISLILAEHKHG